LKDDTKIYGWYAENSFTSSKGDDRDIFIQYTYNKGEDGIYTQNPDSNGIYIPKDSIKSIEFIITEEGTV
jgi:hypothetical protein